VGLFSSKYTEDTRQTNDSSSNGSQQYQFDPNILFNKDFILQMLSGRAQDSNVGGQVDAYRSTGLGNINKANDAKQRILGNMLRSRGIANTAGGVGAQTALTSEGFGDRVNFLNTLPQYQDDITRQRIGDLGSFVTANNSPIGVNTSQSSHGVQTGHSEGVKPGGIFSDILGAAASAAGAFYGGRKKP
jgi:hypothetical protein